MDGKVIVVTGASGALGKVVVEAALARGARVAGIDHAPTQVPATPGRLELGGVDLTDAAKAGKAIDAVVSHFGRLDALVNIAGGFAFEAVAEGDPRTWQHMYALNVLTALHASQSAIPHLAAAGAGRIVNVGAMGALQAGAGMGPYAASTTTLPSAPEAPVTTMTFPSMTGLHARGTTKRTVSSEEFHLQWQGIPLPNSVISSLIVTKDISHA